MAIDFPANPTIGQIMILGDLTYTWDGLVWRVSGGTGGGSEEGVYLPFTGGTMTGYITLHADPVSPLHAATKQYADFVAAVLPPTATGPEMVAATRNDVFATPANTLALTGTQVSALATMAKTLVPAINELKANIDFIAAGGIFVGAFNSSNGTIVWTAASGQSGNELPLPTPATKGFYLIADVGGDVPPAGAPGPHYDVGDWVISDGVAWHRLAFGGAIIAVIASAVSVTPAVEGQTNVQTALEALSTNKVAGPPAAVTDRLAAFDGATGKLIKDTGQTLAGLEAALRAYIDSQDTQFVLKAGDVMTGQLSIPLAPAVDASAASKKYVDDAVRAVAGGVSVVVAGPELEGNGLPTTPITFMGIRVDSDTFTGDGLALTPLTLAVVDGGTF